MGKITNWKKRIIRFFIYVVLIAIVITIIYPFVFMVLNSFKMKSEYYRNIFGMPRAFQFKNYKIAMERFDVVRLGLHSLIVTVCAVAVNVSVCAMGAYAFAKLKFRFHGNVLGMIIGCMMVPSQVLMIPVYLIMAKLGLINNFASAILFYVASSVPFGIYMPLQMTGLLINCIPTVLIFIFCQKYISKGLMVGAVK